MEVDEASDPDSDGSYNADYGDCDESDPDVDPDRRTAGANLVDVLLWLRMSGKLQAKWVCIIAHWAHFAGAEHGVNDIRMRPGESSGNYQKRLDRVQGFNVYEKGLAKLSVPSWAPHCAARVVVNHQWPSPTMCSTTKSSMTSWRRRN